MSRLLLACLLLPSLALAQVPQKIGYQGRLMQNDGTPQAGSVSVTFAIFDAASAGTSLWSETQNLALSDGFYATQLGAATPIPTTVFDGAERYLSLTIGGAELTPRQAMASVPYAISAQSAQNAVNAQSATNATNAQNAITAQNALNADGNLFPDPYFENGPANWITADGNVIASSTAIGGARVFANGANQVAHLSSAKMVPVNPDHVYEVKGSFRRPTTAGSAGVIYLAVRLFDADKNEIVNGGQWWFYPVAGVALTDTTWHTYSALFGLGTGMAIPAAARYMKVGAILNYDNQTAGNRIYEAAGLGIRDIETPASLAAGDGSAGVASGTASALYTPVQTIPRGVYLVTYYHCLGSATNDYYIQATAEATSGTIASDFYNKYFSQLTSFTQPPFVMKVRSETATVRFKVSNAAAGTITNPVGNCTSFYWTRIGN